MDGSERGPYSVSKWPQKETIPGQQKEVPKEPVPHHQKEVQKETVQKSQNRCTVQQKQVLATNLNSASLKLVQLFQS
jgi:hypothetical protein